MGRHSRPEPAAARAPWQRPVVVLATLLAVLAVVAVVLATRGSDDAGARADVQTTPAPLGSAAPTPTPSPSTAAPTPSTTPPATPTPSPTPSPTAPAAAPLPKPPPLLSFTVLDTAWVSVTDSAGHQLVARVFQAGEKASYDGPAFTVRTGNSGGVRFVVDGKPRPPGGSGQVESFTVRR